MRGVIQGSLTPPSINNIKTHIYLTPKGRDKLLAHIKLFDLPIKRHSNFFVCRDPSKERRVYIIFEKQGFINITGIRDFSSLNDVIPQLCNFFTLLPIDVVSSEPIVDNISAAGAFNRRIDLNRLRQSLNSKSGLDCYFTVILNRNKFPGASCRTKQSGTITVFTSGKYVIVGSKCLNHMEQIFTNMCASISIL
jgi:TATA-box binding protein (TBP) (component of TFIID and TFIIIB)